MIKIIKDSKLSEIKGGKYSSRTLVAADGNLGKKHKYGCKIFKYPNCKK
ncbi:hypothetical protein [Companilactobacillus mishanensis]|nr:hypothetical protein [Companilactobacillus mishanensis]